MKGQVNLLDLSEPILIFCGEYGFSHIYVDLEPDNETIHIGIVFIPLSIGYLSISIDDFRLSGQSIVDGPRMVKT